MKKIIYFIHFFLIITAPTLEAKHLSMKIKKAIYDFFIELEEKNIDVSHLICEKLPDTVNKFGALLNPDTDVPEVKLDSLFDSRTIIYIEDPMIASIKSNNFNLTQQEKYLLLYKIGLLKFAQEKYRRYPALFLVGGLITGIFSVVSIEWDFLMWLNNEKNYTKTAQLGLANGIISTCMFTLYYLTHKNLSLIEEREALLEIINKAHVFAQSYL